MFFVLQNWYSVEEAINNCSTHIHTHIMQDNSSKCSALGSLVSRLCLYMSLCSTTAIHNGHVFLIVAQINPCYHDNVRQSHRTLS